MVPQTFFAGRDSYSDIHVKNVIELVTPNGMTPLTRHIFDLQNEFRKMSIDLNRNGQKVAIVLATVGLPNETGCSQEKAISNFVNTMRALEGLSIWIVIRLCTDDDDLVSFYNDLDDDLEVSIEVLDDFYGKAKEVYEHNK